jgi:hypothetical protein
METLQKLSEYILACSTMIYVHIGKILNKVRLEGIYVHCTYL